MEMVNKDEDTNHEIVNFECEECGAEFQKNKKEFLRLYGEVFDDTSLYVVECPDCGSIAISKIKNKTINSNDEIFKKQACELSCLIDVLQDKPDKEKSVDTFFESNEEVKKILLKKLDMIHWKIPEEAEKKYRGCIDAVERGDIEEAYRLIFLILFMD